MPSEPWGRLAPYLARHCCLQPAVCDIIIVQTLCWGPLLQVDLFSLGVVVFEMWHRFSTAMERAVLLRELREAGKLPPAWEAEHQQVARLIRCARGQARCPGTC